MKVGKWGTSLAMRLPASVVEQLKLQDGDEIEIEIAGGREFHIRRDTRRQQALDEALDAVKSLSWELPPGFTFRRDSANDR